MRREQTAEEKQRWRALRAARFAGFKFRRQHPIGPYCLDFYCPCARLSVELDGFQHGMPGQRPLSPALSPLGRGEREKTTHSTFTTHCPSTISISSSCQAVEVMDQPVNLRVLEAGGLHGK
ncbi:MAG: hypothetical protein DME22_11780 [Verrucomicrobia bacterium]|nr:MAG: hypothetical protein DME22_11780 [Verrucomicrobiota bacterium]